MKNKLYAREFIGEHVRVLGSSHSGYLNIEGKIVDETKNTFTIENHLERVVPKKGCKFELTINDRKELINGDDIMYRPEDRIKRLG